MPHCASPPRPPPRRRQCSNQSIPCQKRNFAGVVPGGYSLITAPELAICLSSRACPDGYARSTPQARQPVWFRLRPMQRGARPVDTEGRPGNHGPPVDSQVTGNLCRHVFAVRSRCPRAHNSNRSLGQINQIPGPQHHNTNGAVSPPEGSSPVKGKHSPRRPIGAVRCYESATHRLHQVEVSLGCVDVSAGARVFSPIAGGRSPSRTALAVSSTPSSSINMDIYALGPCTTRDRYAQASSRGSCAVIGIPCLGSRVR